MSEQEQPVKMEDLSEKYQKILKEYAKRVVARRKEDGITEEQLIKEILAQGRERVLTVIRQQQQYERNHDNYMSR